MGGGLRFLLLALLALQCVLGLSLLSGEAAPREADRSTVIGGRHEEEAVPLAPAPTVSLGHRKAIGPHVPQRRDRIPTPPPVRRPLEVVVEVRGPAADSVRAKSFRVRVRVEQGQRTPWALHDEVEMRPGEPHRFHGLAPGRVEVALVRRPPLGTPGREGSAVRPRLRWPRSVVVSLPVRKAVVLSVVAERWGRARIVVEYPAGARPGAGEVLLWPRVGTSGAEFLRRPLPAPDRETGEAILPATVPIGAYDVLVHVLGKGTDGAEVGWTASARLVVADGLGGEARLVAVPARRVAGVVRDPTGHPVLGAEVGIAVIPWRRNGSAAVPWEVETDEEGGFHLGGLPHDRTLRIGASPCLPGGPGWSGHRVEVLQAP